MDIELLEARARIFRGVRAFFDARGFIEVHTPLLSPDLIPETCLEVFKTEYNAPSLSSKDNKELYLIPSPELWMKKLIAEHGRNIYQICACFRNCEPRGALHNPEFTMLEYYTMNSNYRDSLSLTEDLFDFLLNDEAARLFQDKDALEALRPPFVRLTMDEAFRKFAGFSLTKAIQDGTLRARAEEAGLNIPPQASEADVYNLIFIHTVEPNLRLENPVALLDYPSVVPCLAALKEGERGVCQRWELYVRGIELANCYTEETSARRVKEYFESEGALKKKSARINHAVDTGYWKMFLPKEDGTPSFPRCSGVALGMDRLIMAFLGRKTIDSTIPFVI